MKKRNYLLVNDKTEKGIVKIDCAKLDGFKFSPKNQVEYDGVLVNEMIIVNPSFISNVLKRKTKRKLEVYLNFIIGLIDSEGNASGDDLREALNGLSRYKSIVENKYSKYLDERYIYILKKKIDLLEQELKNKIIYYKEPTKEETKKTR